MPDQPIILAPIRDTLTGTDPVVEWLVPDILPRGTLIALAGLPGAGKSFLCHTLAIALASGTSFLNANLPIAKVLYFDQENSLPDSTQYLRWAWHGLGCPSIDALTDNLFIARFVLGLKDWPSVAARYVRATAPQLIVIDTTTPACSIDDENDNGEATKAINALRQLQTLVSPAPTIIALKHAKLDNDSGRFTLRGAKAWEGATDGVIFHTRRSGRPRADGLNPTRLIPSKTRAFGLRSTLVLDPEWLPEKVGIKLTCFLEE